MMLFTSPDFKSGGLIPITFTCDGDNVNPNFFLGNVPKNAKSLVLIMDDPDSPSGKFIHWLLWNIDPATTEIISGVKPKGAIIGCNSEGKNKYTGPCPPTGTHRYFFKIYALDKVLDIPETSTALDLIPLIDHNRLDYAQMLGIYQKSLL